jgi:multiple antibiotic resistance protein
MSDPLVQFGVLSFVSLFTMINPLGVVPVYTAMTASLSREQSRHVALKASVTAFTILVLFAVGGQFIFEFFGISTHSLRIVGGVIFFAMGYEMLQARLTRTQYDDESIHEYISDIAITPLGIPMICGPGAITSAILLMDQAAGWSEIAVLFAMIISVMALTYIFLRSSKRVMDILGENGNKVMMRLMGLIVMVIAVESFFAGLKPIAQGIIFPQ